MRIRRWTSALAVTVTAAAGVWAGAAPASAACSLGINSISPAAGFVSGGATVTLTGCAFTTSGALSVSFGSNVATSSHVDSDTSMTAVSPANGSAGAVTVTLTGTPSSNSATTSFTYLALPTL